MGRNTWLVKSQGRILGPFSREEVSRLVLDFEVVILDEVARPFNRWVYLRDSEEFKKEVEEVRLKNLSQESDTTTIFIDSETNTDTMAISDTASGFTDDLTEELSSVSLNEIVLDSVNEKVSQSRQGVSNKTYVFEGDNRLQKETQKTVRMQWIIAVSLVFVVLGLVFFKQFIEKPMKIQKEFNSLSALAINQLGLGEYKTALRTFQKAERLTPDNKTNDLYLGMLLIQVDQQTVLGKRYLNSVIERGETKNFKLAYTGIGLAHMIDGQYNDSMDFFQKALEVDSEYSPALINLGAANLMLGEHQKATNYLQLAYKDGIKDGAAMVMLLISYYEMFKQTNDKNFLLQALIDLNKIIESAQDYRQEYHFFKALIQSITTEKYNVTGDIEKILDMDPHLTKRHRHNIFVYRNMVQWKSLLKYCNQLAAKIPLSAIKFTFEGYCNLRAGDTVQAQRVVEDSITQDGENALIQTIYALTMLESGIEDPAKLNLQRAISSAEGSLKLPYQLMAEICQRSQSENCSAQDYWSKLLNISPNSMSAIVGLADEFIKNGDIDNSEKLLLRGENLSKNYKPLLKVKSLVQLEKQGG